MSTITRRKLLATLATVAAPEFTPRLALAQGPPALPSTETPKGPRFAYQEVVERARRLADQPFQETTTWRLPRVFDKLDYDAWREIRFKPEQAMLASGGGPFRLETFHLGFLYRRPVTINLIRDGIAAPIPYSTALFDYGRVKPDESLPVNFGFAGFRLHYPLNDPHVNDEVISFLGASYFRFLGREQKYGLSARALCVEAGTDSESFPFFREFWIETPEIRAGRATIYGLVDDKAATAAFRFDLAPGQDSELEVQATLFPRRAGVKFGLAPLTSMFLAGENDHRISPGFRAELHDSDGLLMETGASEWLWRPLANPSFARTTSFLDNEVKGFGLMQRDRTFESYQDLDLSYEARPSYFVEPSASWGPGRVELIELATADETNDNIVASWTPAAAPAPLLPYVYAYKITACLDEPRFSPNGRVVNTFTAPAKALGSSEAAAVNSKRFLVDFAGGDLGYYVADPSEVEVVATTTNGQILRKAIAANAHIEGLRAMFDVSVKSGETADLRLYLRAGNRALTETWTFPWTSP
ncbi:glucan biosynthesis protein [Methylocystis bryophila]|uniref:Glucan biosynthesis protein G n=1 Tax=Methylocystis bryophila TaxID=655015 RepID=A0A1W6MVI8_9HYPH|nr:glucan biosynthesis protein [Methylocystis bryophila]ARN81604.1 glucan biosynthesis protein G [Methylocystis bryophila]BDV37643.1 putative glucans biosynthesis protein D [Methylocystis bryophila]